MWFKDTGKPLLFVDYDDNGKLFINPAAVDLLTTFKEPIAIIGAVGIPGHGKSFTLNQFLHRNDGFEVAAGIDRCTKGMWLWDTVLFHKASGTKFLLLDSEGFDRHSGPIGDKICSEKIARLSFLTGVTTEISVRKTQQEAPSDFKSVFPTFIWLIRDFIEMKLRGNTPDQHLQEALMEEYGYDTDDSCDTNQISEMIKELFPTIHCYTLLRPMHEEKYLQKLDRVRYCNMRPEYKEQREKFREFVLEKTKVKMVDGMVLTGPMLLGITREIINSFNNDTVPVISSIWKHVHDQENHTKKEEDDEEEENTRI